MNRFKQTNTTAATAEKQNGRAGGGGGGGGYDMWHDEKIKHNWLPTPNHKSHKKMETNKEPS